MYTLIYERIVLEKFSGEVDFYVCIYIYMHMYTYVYIYIYL